MRWKTTGAVAVAVALVIAPLTASAAFADDSVEVDPATVEVVEETPTEPEAVPEPEPVVESESVAEPVAEPAPVQAPVETAPAKEPAPVAKTVAPKTVKEPVLDEWYTWLTDLAPGVETPKNADDVTWPQTLIGQGQLTPACGEWAQQDRYKGTRAEIDAVVGDGVLEGLPPEDSGIVKEWKFVYGGDCPPPVTNTCETYVDGPTSTNLVPLWSNVDTRADGHYEYVEDGLHVWTTSNTSQAKVSLGYPAAFPLANTGVLDLAWTGSTPPPGINLFVNFGADGSGTLVYESVYGQDLWLTNGSSAAVKANAPVNGGGNGSQWHGTIDQWLSVYPEAQVVGIAFSLGSGVLGDGVIASITAGCATYTFDYVEPAPKPEPVVEHKTESTTDCYAMTVTYQDFTRTTGEPTFDPATNTWTQGEFGEWVADGDPRVIPATSEDCPLPEDEITYGEWQYTIDCDDEVGDVIPATREVTVKSWGYNEQGEQVPASSTYTEEGEHVVTQDDVEIPEEACPVPPVTPEEPQTPEEPILPASLPITGSNPAGLYGLGAGALVAALAGAVFLVIHRRREAAGVRRQAAEVESE